MYDSEYLYFGLHARDDSLTSDSGQSWWLDDNIPISG